MGTEHKGIQVIVVTGVRDGYKEMAEDPGLKLRFEDWRREEANLNKQIQHEEQKLDSNKSKIYLLLAADFLFQGLLLCQANAHGWIPLLLSLVASGIAIFGLLFEFGESRHLQIKLEDDKNYAEAMFKATELLRTRGNDYKHDGLHHQPHLRKHDKQNRLVTKVWRKGYEALLLGILITFSTLMAFVLKK